MASTTFPLIKKVESAIAYHYLYRTPTRRDPTFNPTNNLSNDLLPASTGINWQPVKLPERKSCVQVIEDSCQTKA
jgi:hypothetical protein